MFYHPVHEEKPRRILVQYPRLPGEMSKIARQAITKTEAGGNRFAAAIKHQPTEIFPLSDYLLIDAPQSSVVFRGGAESGKLRPEKFFKAAEFTFVIEGHEVDIFFRQSVAQPTQFLAIFRGQFGKPFFG